jgi:thiamine-monophosphate kinase
LKDEFAFISRVKPEKIHQSSLITGIGDDAAVYRGAEQFDEVVCVDTMVEGVHFRRDTLTPLQVGKKALVANVSDLAAMGAVPMYYLVSVAIPSTWSEEELDDVYKGMKQVGDDYKMDLIGGDTVSTSAVFIITITVIGRVERGRKLFRNQAKPGDVVFLTGPVGGSAAGLQLLFDKGYDGPFSVAEKQLVLVHQEPIPQVEAGRIFAEVSSRISLNDISDGVASEANELAESSNVKIVLDLERIPFHPAMVAFPIEKQLEWALFGGEDYQLIGSMSIKAFSQLKERCHNAGIMITVIGEVLEGEASVFGKQGTELIRLEKKGYNHFKRR